ncbi:hypothetical protein OE88DRAFT_1657028 [Heliocybe sulcata]|uniref:Uncharacterized protein n=1 Tax=Heliocybe sulcata TaxID=5364 RepID=A0A5C3N9N0_9AGAM|nr:hypothetical protein OE88DRAFT_1657028 [Heliocybe sulcata]
MQYALRCTRLGSTLVPLWCYEHQVFPALTTSCRSVVQLTAVEAWGNCTAEPTDAGVLAMVSHVMLLPSAEVDEAYMVSGFQS